MSQPVFSCPSNRRSFTSVSATDGSRGFRPSQPPVCQPMGFTYGIRGNNTSQSFHNFGGRQRMSCCGGFQGSECSCRFNGIREVQCLEQQNQILRTKWQLLQNQNIPAVKKDLKPLCEGYTTNLRRKLDLVLCEKNKLEIQHKAMQNLVEEHRSKYQEELNRRTNAENDFVVLKKEVDAAFKYQKELEMKRDLMKENIDFLRVFYTEELSALNRQLYDTSVVLNMNNSRRLNMDNLIQSIECWYQTIAQKSKEEANLFYQSQIQTLQNQSCQFHESLQRNNTEIAELNRMIQILQCQVDNEKKKVVSLQTAISTTEQHGACALKEAQANFAELQNTLQNSKDKLAALLRDYHELMNTKLALDIEIATYKTMLEGEEKRICTCHPMNMAVLSNGCRICCMKQ
ncbi:PREDICTED: keratin, type II cytoskeletal 5-like isoform X2 [Gekko japonicus]|uniref:Keratin, type II cytoskeletal 5-like isoform X2 n=1 Tax=Gekko japonicus TaxID=146911 RepID=A0ABM1K9Q9_GEKJA|nr:PREDICTED: keratin, type II cytoskeletal 5-like isoform X2 [Gekko japonicus]